MSLVIAIVILVISLVVLIFAGDKFVDSSVAIAKKLKMPQAVIGATFVSLGTTLPEILVTIFSINEQAGGIAVGNAVGSIIFNSALIGGVLLVFSKTIKKQKSISPIILIFSVLLLLVMCINGVLGVLEAIILLVIFVVFIIFNYFEIKKSPDSQNEEVEKKDINVKKEILIFILSATAIGVSAYFMVEEAKAIGLALKVSDTIIGLIVVAIGTSLPELVTTISSIKKKQPSLGFGNIIGSNIINCTLLIGITGALSHNGLAISKETLLVSIPVSLLCSSLLFLSLKLKNKKLFGILLFSIYISYYIYFILSATKIIVI